MTFDEAYLIGMSQAAEDSADLDERADFSPYYDGDGSRDEPNIWDDEEPAYPFEIGGEG